VLNKEEEGIKKERISLRNNKEKERIKKERISLRFVQLL